MADFRVTLKSGLRIIDRPWDSAAAEKRVFAWATSGEDIDFGKAANAYLIADPDTGLKGDLHLPVGDIVDGELVINAAALRAARGRLGQDILPDVTADVKERANDLAGRLLDDYKAKEGRADAEPSGIAVMIPLPAEAVEAWPDNGQPKPPHITVAYMPDVDPVRVIDVALVVADELHQRWTDLGRDLDEWTPWYEGLHRLGDMQLVAGGLRYFEHEDKRIAYVGVSVPLEFARARDRLVDRLGRIGLEVSRAGQTWIPHITLATVRSGEVYEGLVPGLQWTPTTLEVWQGDAIRYLIGPGSASGVDKIERVGDRWFASGYGGREKVGDFDSESDAREALAQAKVASWLTGEMAKADQGADFTASAGESYDAVADMRACADACGISLSDIEHRADRSDEEKAEIRSRWAKGEGPNMGSAGLREWLESPFAGPNRKTGAERDRARRVANRALRIMAKSTEDWTDEDYTGALQIMAFIARMKDVEQGEPLVVDGREGPSARDASLRDWGFDPKADRQDAPARGSETKTYTITGSREAFEAVNTMLLAMRICGDWGASRALQVQVDGDGSFEIAIDELDNVKVDETLFNDALESDVVKVNNAIKILRQDGAAKPVALHDGRTIVLRPDATKDRQQVLFEPTADGGFRVTLPLGTQVQFAESSARVDAAVAETVRRAPSVHTESRTRTEWITRADRITLPAEHAPIVHPDGWVTYPVLYSRGGNIQLYGTTREYRPKAEVFKRASMDTGIGGPWELRHSRDLLNPNTVRGVVRGVMMTFDEYHDGEHTFGWARAWDRGLMHAIEGDGTNRPEAPEVSLAFRCKAHREPGTSDDGQPFDQWISDIIVNSLASEPYGRAETARVLGVRADAESITVHGADELLALAQGRPPKTTVVFRRDSWARFDAAKSPRPTVGQPQTHKDKSMLKKLIKTAMELGMAEDAIAQAIGMPADGLAAFMESDKDLTPDQLNALVMAMPEKAADPTSTEGDGMGTGMKPEQDMETVKVEIGDAEYMVPPAVAEEIAKMAGQAKMDGAAVAEAKLAADRARKRADASDEALAKAEVELAKRQDAMKDMVTRADAMTMAREYGTSMAEAMDLCRLGHGAEWTPEARKDADGGDLEISLDDWQRAAIKAAFGDQADSVLARIDAAPEGARAYLTQERLTDARGLLAARQHKSKEAIASLNRMRDTNARADQKRLADDGSEGPLAAAARVRKQLSAAPVGVPQPQPNGAA